LKVKRNDLLARLKSKKVISGVYMEIAGLSFKRLKRGLQSFKAAAARKTTKNIVNNGNSYVNERLDCRIPRSSFASHGVTMVPTVFHPSLRK